MKIALVGPGGVGKDMLSEFAAFTFDLTHVSSGDIIRQYVVDNNLGAPDRVTLRRVGNEMREKYGADCLVQKAIKMHYDNIVMSGLRAVAEAKAFKDNGGIIISVDAPLEVRFAWIQAREDMDNTMTFEQFKERDTVESSNPDPNAQNIKAVMALADYHLVNDSDKEALCLKFKKIIDSISF